MIAFLFTLLFVFNSVHADEPLPLVIQGMRTAISSLDPYSTVSVENFEATSNVIEPLFRLDPLSGALNPWLGLEVKTYPWEKRFRVKLRKGVHFHNGEEFSAEDVRFTFESFSKPAYKAAIWQGMWPDVKSVKIVDPLTVDFTMKNWRYQSFESLLTAMRILPKAFYGNISKTKFRKQIIGTGPFEMERFEGNVSLRLRPNSAWWGKQRPEFNLLIKKVSDQELAKQMFAKEELDFFKADKKIENAAHMEVVKSTLLGTGFWIDLNLKNPLFQSVKVRRALLLLWQRDDLNRRVYDGSMEPALDIFSPNTEYYPKGVKEKSSVKEARRLLEQDGWHDDDQDQVLEKKFKAFRFTLLVRSSEQERWATLFQADAAALGIQVSIEKVMEDAQWLKRLKDGKYDAFAGEGGLTNEPNSLAWQSEAFYNFSKYKNEQVDQLTRELEREFALPKRRLMMRKLIAIIRKDQPQVPGLISRDDFYLTSKRLHIDPHHPGRAWLWQLR